MKGIRYSHGGIRGDSQASNGPIRTGYKVTAVMLSIFSILMAFSGYPVFHNVIAAVISVSQLER